MTTPAHPHRRTAVLIGVVTVSAVLLLTAASIGYLLLRPDGDEKDGYARPDRLCDAVDVTPVSALKLAEQTTSGRSTSTDDGQVRCEVQLDTTPPDGNLYQTYVTADVLPDANRAGDAFDAEMTPDATPVDGLGDEAAFATSELRSTSGSEVATLTTFALIVRDANLVLAVQIEYDRNRRWSRDTARSVLVTMARRTMTELAR